MESWDVSDTRSKFLSRASATMDPSREQDFFSTQCRKISAIRQLVKHRLAMLTQIKETPKGQRILREQAR